MAKQYSVIVVPSSGEMRYVFGIINEHMRDRGRHGIPSSSAPLIGEEYATRSLNM